MPAIANKPKQKVKERKLTICRKYGRQEPGKLPYHPVLYLGGEWLRDTGFESGQIVNITCIRGKLIITPATDAASVSKMKNRPPKL
jgi:hypothetical protein